MNTSEFADLDDLDSLEMDLKDLETIDAAAAVVTPVPTTSMDVKYLDPMTLKANPWNPNNVDPINQEKLEASIKRDGIKRPIVVRELDDGSLQIIGGQHRTEGAINIGLKTVPVINRGPISDAEAKKETLLDNFRYGSDNLTRLSELLSDPDIGSAETLLATMPIDEEELASYFEHITSADLEADLDAALGEAPEPEPEDDGTVDLGLGKPVRTHQILRFRVSVEDAAKLAELMKETKIVNGYVGSDDLTNDGDALIHLVRDQFE